MTTTPILTSLDDWIPSSFQNVRSSTRTDSLHRCLLNDLFESMPHLLDYEIKYEYEVPDCYGGTFKLDIALLQDGEIKVALLVKAINSNFGKNLNNYLNTTTGEAMRCGLSPLNIPEIIFVTVAPRIAPRFKSNGDVDGFDNVERIKSSRTHSEVFGLLKAHVWAIDFFYDINNVKSLTHKDQFHTITISDLQTK